MLLEYINLFKSPINKITDAKLKSIKTKEIQIEREEIELEDESPVWEKRQKTDSELSGILKGLSIDDLKEFKEF